MAENNTYMMDFINTIDEIYKLVPTYSKYFIGNSIITDEQNVLTTFNIILLIIGILLLNNFSHKNMLTVGTVESWGFASMIILIFFYTLSYFKIVTDIIILVFNKMKAKIIDDDRFVQKYMNLLFSPIIFVISLLLYIISIFLFTIFGAITFIFSEFKSILDISNISEILPKYGILFAIIFIAIVLLYYASFDPSALTTKKYVYVFSIIIPLILIIGYINNSGLPTNDAKYKLLIIGLIIVFFATLFYFYTAMTTQTVTTLYYAINALFILMLIVGLALFFYIFSNYLKSIEGWSGFIIYFIFYIPCLLLDLVKYVRNEFKMTSNVVFILFIIEIILILVYIYLPLLIKYISYSDGIVLLKDSTFLNHSQQIGNNKMFLAPDMTEYSVFELSTIVQNKLPVYNENYSISMWIYLNNQPANFSAYNTESNVFDYGNGKPKITYNNKDVTINGATINNSYTIYFTNTTTDSYEIKLNSQKWNNIVFNYSSTNADLYINGNLEQTFTFDSNLPTYSSADIITVGSDNGLDGAICNIRYYSTPLSSTKISNMYNLLMYKNPPTI